MSRTKELKEKLGGLIDEQMKITTAAGTEKRSFTQEEDEKFNKIEADIKLAQKTLEAEVLMEARSKEFAAPVNQEKDPKGKTIEEKREEYSDAFKLWVVRGQNALDKEQMITLGLESRATQMSKTAAEGGTTVPEGFIPKLEQALLAFGGMVSVARIIKTSTGNDLPYPTVNDTAQSISLIAELGAVSTTATAPTFSSVTFNAFKYGTDFLPISRELVEDSSFNILAEVESMFLTRIARGMNTVLTTANGTSKPNGIVTAATSSGITPLVTSFTRTNIVNLLHTVDPSYRPNAKFMFNDTTLLALKKLVDGDSRPLYYWDPTGNIPAMIEGYGYVINQAMASPGASAKSVLFGDFSKYIIRMVNDIRMVRTEELYRTTDAIGIGAFIRFDGDLLDAGTHPVKYWTHAAS